MVVTSSINTYREPSSTFPLKRGRAVSSAKAEITVTPGGKPNRRTRNAFAGGWSSSRLVALEAGVEPVPPSTEAP
ncbi:hypothetical protein D9M68_415800 [compost metagenome]